jgi:hypothetical protein
MDQHVDPAARAVQILATFLAAADRTAADPRGAVVALGDLLLRTFQGSPESTALLTRFQQEPNNPDVQTAVRGRISEVLLNRPEFGQQLDAALTQVTSPAPEGAPPGVQQAHSTGNVAAVNANTGTVSIRQRTVRIGRLHIPVPIFAIILLLGGGVVIGGGVAAVTAGSDAGDYAFYGIVEGANSELTYFRWTTQKDGSLSGSTVSYGPGTLGNGVPVALSGHQDGNRLSFSATFLLTMNFTGTINGDKLTIQGIGSEGLESTTFQRTTPQEFDRLLSEYKRQHPGTGRP